MLVHFLIEVLLFKHTVGYMSEATMIGKIDCASMASLAWLLRSVFSSKLI